MSLWFIKARMLKNWKKAYEISKRFREISAKMERNYGRNLKLKALKRYFLYKLKKIMIYLFKKLKEE